MELKPLENRQSLGWKFKLHGLDYGNYISLDENASKEDISYACNLIQENAFKTLMELLTDKGEFSDYRIIQKSSNDDPLEQRVNERSAVHPG